MSARPWGPAVVPMGRGVLRAEVQDVPRGWLPPPPGPGSQGTPSPPSAMERGHRARLRLPARDTGGTRPLLHRAPGDAPGAGCEVPATRTWRWRPWLGLGRSTGPFLPCAWMELSAELICHIDTDRSLGSRAEPARLNRKHFILSPASSCLGSHSLTLDNETLVISSMPLLLL